MNLLQNFITKLVALPKRTLYVLIACTALSILLVAILIVLNFKSVSLNKREMSPSAMEQQVVKLTEYEGKVMYVNPNFYPDEDISYVLTDSVGKDIILLRAEDKRLSIVEGLTVKLTGIVVTTKTGNNKVLQVDKVMVKNGTN